MLDLHQQCAPNLHLVDSPVFVSFSDSSIHLLSLLYTVSHKNGHFIFDCNSGTSFKSNCNAFYTNGKQEWIYRIVNSSGIQKTTKSAESNSKKTKKVIWTSLGRGGALDTDKNGIEVWPYASTWMQSTYLGQSKRTLIKSIPVLIYGLECFLLPKSDLKSLDFAVTRFLMKVFSK